MAGLIWVMQAIMMSFQNWNVSLLHAGYFFFEQGRNSLVLLSLPTRAVLHVILLGGCDRHMCVLFQFGLVPVHISSAWSHMACMRHPMPGAR